MFFSSTARVQHIVRSCLKSKVNLSATVFVDNSLASQHRKHWLVRYFGSANFLSYGTNHQLLLKNNSSKTSSCYHYISFPFASLPSTVLCVSEVVPKLLGAIYLQTLRSTKYCRDWMNLISGHFAVPLVVVKTSCRSQHPLQQPLLEAILLL